MKHLMSLIIIEICLLSLISCKTKPFKEIKIIPKPAQLAVKRGEFIFTPESKIVIKPDIEKMKYAADYFRNLINKASGYNLKIEKKDDNIKQSSSIIFTLEGAEADLGEEGYSLSVAEKVIRIKANSAAGVFYGIQTLRQLLPVEIESSVQSVDRKKWSIPCLQIKDMPRYSYRGMHLDVCRHFMPKEFIKKYIDYIAMHKMNTFHWHLTEDQGWRIEIKKYPKLTEIGSWRKETLQGDLNDLSHKFDGKRYGGYYTQDDIREIVDYADTRFVTIIPEIEMPGHSVAALSVYPELSCTGGPFEVRTSWGISRDVYCAGKEKTFEFLENILSEVIELFPSKYIHIGGDECPKERWEKCPDCQKRIKDENLQNEHELQSYFIKRIEKYLISKGRYLIGWDEILEGGLAPEATVMSWRGIKGGMAAAKQGHDVIMTPNSHCYFDYYQGNPDFEPKAIGGYITLKKVYSYNPAPEELSAEEEQFILGAQGNVWTEYIQSPGQVEYMAIPRMAALAEVVWSPQEKREWKDFLYRMEDQFERYKRLGINYSKSVFDVYPVSRIDTLNHTFRIGFETQLLNPEIRYTLDGSNPELFSKKYNLPFQLDKTTLVKAGIFKNGRLAGDITERLFQVPEPAVKPVK